MSEQATQVLTVGRRINVPLPERFTDEYVYFRANVDMINFARPDGGRVSFVRNWLKTNNVHDINYIRQLIAEGQHQLEEVTSDTAELEYNAAFDPEAQSLSSLREKISADPRFAAAIAEMLRTAGTDADLLRSLQGSAEQALQRRNSTTESFGKALSGIANSQSLNAVAATSTSEAPNGDKKAESAPTGSASLPDTSVAGTMLKR